MALTDLTDEQRSDALKKAAAARAARAQLRDDLKSGKVALADVIESDDPVVSRMRVRLLLESMPGIGRVKAERIMDELNISASRRVQGLGHRQREQLIERFSE